MGLAGAVTTIQRGLRIFLQGPPDTDLRGFFLVGTGFMVELFALGAVAVIEWILLD